MKLLGELVQVLLAFFVVVFYVLAATLPLVLMFLCAQALLKYLGS